LLTASVGFGQGVTTSSISGFVTDKQGQPVASATVTAIHTPSGTRAVTTSRSNGEYNFDGLRPGGPYTISVSINGFNTAEKSGYSLATGVDLTLNFTVISQSDVVSMAAVTVSESRDTTFDGNVMGTGDTFNAAQIGQITSVRQDVQDIENTDPRASLVQSGNNDVEYNLSVEGQNPRDNLFLIDGVVATDNFGLNSNGYAGLRNPLPLPWIESLAFKLNEYDVTYSDYLGGVVDATLKSGTNSFHGSLYEMYMGTHFRGADPSAGIPNPHEPMQVHTTGGTLGGPIIANKLFFFVGYEAFRELALPPAQQFFPEDNAADTAVVNQILAKAQSLGDTNQGSFVAGDHYWQQNAVAKIDWNITDAQKFEFTFRHTDGLDPLFYNYSSSTETSLSGSWYNSHRVDQSYTAKLNSDWSILFPGLTTELEATYKRYNGTAALNGTDWAGVTIDNMVGTSAQASANANPSAFALYLGPSGSYMANQLYTKEQEAHGYAEYSVGAHTFKFGIQTDETLWDNEFIPNYNGAYTFTNVTDFLNQTPTGFTLATGNPGYNLASAIAHGELMDVEPMVQDTWKPTPDLTLLFGVRLDYPYESGKPIFSQAFYSAYGYSNQATIDGNSTISPRFGFNYSLPGDLKTQIRGGAGLFLGQNPLVWLENSFSTAGQLTTASSAVSNSSVPIPGFIFTGPQSVPSSLAVSSAAPNIDIAASNFHWPANWKENIAVDHQLPFWGLTVTAEFDFSQVQKGVYTEEINLKPATSGPAFMPDGAIRYAGNITPTNIGAANFVTGYTTTNFYTGASSSSAGGAVQLNPQVAQVFELANTDKGGSQEYTLQISRPMKDNWAFSIGYTHTHATEVSGMDGTTASSSVFGDDFVNPNDNVAYRSLWAEPDKVVVSFARRFHFFKHANTATTLSAQYIAENGLPYSYVFKGDADGSSFSSQSLFYVPTGPTDPKVSWLSSTEEGNFFAWLAQHPDLAKYAGQVAPRNAFYSPDQETVNVHVEQQIPIYSNKVSFTVFADCYNFANLLNRKWGIVNNYGTYETADQTVAGTGYNPAGNGGQGQYIYVFNAGTQNVALPLADESRWSVQIGGRLEF